MKQLPAQPNQSLIDGLTCLQAVATAADPVGSRELARQLRMEPTRINRLLKTLAHLGLTAQTGNKKYSIGPAIHVLSAQTLFASGLLRNALPILRELHQFNCITALGVLWQDHVSYLCHALPDSPMEEGLGRVSLYPATQSSIGMVLLAAKPDSEIRRLYARKQIPGYGQKLNSLINDLKTIRKQGHAVIETDDNISLAVPIGSNPDAAIALSGKNVRKQFNICLNSLSQAAMKLTKAKK